MHVGSKSIESKLSFRSDGGTETKGRCCPYPQRTAVAEQTAQERAGDG